MDPESNIHVLYVDDEVTNLNAFQAAFRRYFTIYLASSAAEARKILWNHSVAILITDQRMPEVTGSQLLAEAVKVYPNQIRILLSGYADVEAIICAINKGFIFKYLEKPWNEKLLIETIKDAYRLYKLKEESIKKEEELNTVKTKLNQALDRALRDKLGINDNL